MLGNQGYVIDFDSPDGDFSLNSSYFKIVEKDLDYFDCIVYFDNIIPIIVKLVYVITLVGYFLNWEATKLVEVQVHSIVEVIDIVVDTTIVVKKDQLVDRIVAFLRNFTVCSP